MGTAPRSDVMWDNPDNIVGIAWTELRLIYCTPLLTSPGGLMCIFIRVFI